MSSHLAGCGHRVNLTQMMGRPHHGDRDETNVLKWVTGWAGTLHGDCGHTGLVTVHRLRVPVQAQLLCQVHIL